MERVKGLEPSASTLARSRSSQLSYTRILLTDFQRVVVVHSKKVRVKGSLRRDFGRGIG